MTEDEFWDHIRAARHADPDEHAKRLTARYPDLQSADLPRWTD